MAFGFPAYHTELCPLAGSERQLREMAYAALSHLGWKIQDDTPEQIWAQAGLNLWSWGERVRIRFLEKGGMEITSQCRLVTQCFDWGRNSQNVKRLLAELERLM